MLAMPAAAGSDRYAIVAGDPVQHRLQLRADRGPGCPRAPAPARPRAGTPAGRRTSVGNVARRSAPRSGGTTTAISHIVVALGTEPVERDGGGPGLVERAERLGGVRLEVFGEARLGLGSSSARFAGAQAGGSLAPGRVAQAVPEQPVGDRPGRTAPVRARLGSPGDPGTVLGTTGERQARRRRSPAPPAARRPRPSRPARGPAASSGARPATGLHAHRLARPARPSRARRPARRPTPASTPSEIRGDPPQLVDLRRGPCQRQAQRQPAGRQARAKIALISTSLIRNGCSRWTARVVVARPASAARPATGSGRTRRGSAAPTDRRRAPGRAADRAAPRRPSMSRQGRVPARRVVGAALPGVIDHQQAAAVRIARRRPGSGARPAPLGSSAAHAALADRAARRASRRQMRSSASAWTGGWIRPLVAGARGATALSSAQAHRSGPGK